MGSRESVGPTSYGIGFSLKKVKIVGIDTSAGQAFCVDEFANTIAVRIDIARAKGALPATGETWLIDRSLGIWTFVAVVAYDGNRKSAAPTDGTWEAGDQIQNAAPTEMGSAGSKYVVTGWICVASGSPGTWLEMRALTGN